jgi:hypothetical protein
MSITTRRWQWKVEGTARGARKIRPGPGLYVSTTALYDAGNPNPRDPHRYVDALTIPYIVLHPRALKYARLGDFATVANLQNGRVSAALVADVSAPDLPFGEGSIALAKALDIDSSPRTVGRIEVLPMQLFDAWGGFSKLNECLADD